MNTINDAIAQLQNTRKILMDALVHVDVLLAVLAPDAAPSVPVAGVIEPSPVPSLGNSESAMNPPQQPIQPIRSGDFSA